MYVLYIITNKNLNLSKGKLAAQVSHAAIDSILNSDRELVKKYMCERKVVVLQTTNKKYSELKNILSNNNIKFFPIVDAGLTEVKPFTETCFSVEILNHQFSYNNIFKYYKLLKD